MLTNKQEQLWHKYEAAERAKARKESLRALEEFIRSMSLETIDDWTPWASKLAEEVVDHKSGFPIRQPLFDKVIFPALLRGAAKKQSGCARWLAGCAQLINSSSKQLESMGGPYGLLKMALEQDPNDSLAKGQLIDLLEGSLKYAIHELPFGVLNEQGNGATIAECSGLLDDLREFVKLINERRISTKYQKLIDSCAFHYKHYAIYLAEREKYVDYPDYLNRMIAARETPK